MAYQLESLESGARSALLRPSELDGVPVHWLRRLGARIWAQIMLRHMFRRRRAQSISDLPPHLLTDVGLPQDFSPIDGLARPQPPV